VDVHRWRALCRGAWRLLSPRALRRARRGGLGGERGTEHVGPERKHYMPSHQPSWTFAQLSCALRLRRVPDVAFGNRRPSYTDPVAWGAGSSPLCRRRIEGEARVVFGEACQRGLGADEI